MVRAGGGQDQRDVQRLRAASNHFIARRSLASTKTGLYRTRKKAVSKRLLTPLTVSALLLGSAAATTPPPPRLSRPSRPYDVRHYRLLVRLDPRTGAYQTSTTITFQVTAPMSVLELDAVGLHPTGAWLLSKPGDPDGGQATALPVVARENQKDEIQGSLVVTLPVRLLPGSEATVEIGTMATARREMSGFFVVQDPDTPKRPPLYLTHFEPLGARRFFPCHDDPSDKATFDVTVETDAKLQVIASGRRVEDVAQAGGAKHRVRYAMGRPLPTYLLGLAVGAFDQDSLDDGGVPLDVHLLRGRPGAATYALQTTREAMMGFQRYLDTPYPFDRYGQLEAPLFPSAALENAALSFISRPRLTLPAPEAQLGRIAVSTTVAHQLAHQWFGGMVTMRWWDDVWVSEALASHLATRFVRDRFGADIADLQVLAELQEGYFRTDAGPRSHPVQNRELLSLEDAFDAITYSKGAQVVRMVEELLGEERMSAGLSLFLREFAYRNGSGADLLTALGAAQQGGPPPRRPTGAPADTPVAEFAKSWLERRGHPVVSVSWRYDAARRQTVLTARQRPSRDGDDARWHVRLPVALRRRAPRFDIDAMLVLDPGKPEAQLAVPTPSAPEWVAWNRGGLALVSVEAKEVSEAGWALIAQSDPDPASRFLALGHLLKPTLGELSKAAEEALGRALSADPSPALRYQIGRRLSKLPGSLRPTLGRVVLQAAQGPAGVDPTDPTAVTLARAGAVELLGKVPGVEAQRLLIELAQGKGTPIDLLGPAAEGLARRGDDVAMSALEGAVRVQGPRGSAYVGRVLGAYGAVAAPGHLREVVRVARENAGRPGVVGDILRGLFYNEELRKSPELPQAIADLVLGSPQLDEDLQARALEAVEGLKTKEARAVLESVRQRARAARVRILANLLLTRTFG